MSKYEFRKLTEEEMSFVSGGDGFPADATVCVGSIASAVTAPNVGSIAVAIGACIAAVNSTPPADGNTANCVGENACVNASGDGGDGAASVGSADGDGGGCGGGDGGCSD